MTVWKLFKFKFYYSSSCSYRRVSWGRERTGVCKRRTGGRSVVCPSKSLATYVHIFFISFWVKKNFLQTGLYALFHLFYFPFQRKWLISGSTMSSQCSCAQTAVGLSPRRRETCTSQRWKLRMQGTTHALFLVPSWGRASTPSSSLSSLYPLMMVSHYKLQLNKRKCMLIFLIFFNWLRRGEKISSRHQGEISRHYCHAGVQHHLGVLCSWKVSFMN